MTSAQWLFEYLALREKEKDQNELTIQILKAVRHMLVSVLGLNLLKKDGDNEDESFIPLSLIAGRREAVDYIMENLQREESAQAAIEDEEFEKLSSAIASGEDLGDMSPLFDVDETVNKKLNTWLTPDRELELQRLGVKIIDEQINEVGHVDVDSQLIKDKKLKRAIETKQAKEQIAEQIKQEKQNLKSRGMKVTFDDG
jgi:hypothetical protein